MGLGPPAAPRPGLQTLNKAACDPAPPQPVLPAVPGQRCSPLPCGPTRPGGPGRGRSQGPLACRCHGDGLPERVTCASGGTSRARDRHEAGERTTDPGVPCATARRAVHAGGRSAAPPAAQLHRAAGAAHLPGPAPFSTIGGQE